MTRLIIWSRAVPYHVVPRQPTSASKRRPVPRQQYSCLLAGFLPISAAASIYLFKPPYAIRSVPSLLGHVVAYRWCSLPRVRRHRASSPQGNSSNECCLCITMDQLMCASLFPHSILIWSAHVESITKSGIVRQIPTTAARCGRSPSPNPPGDMTVASPTRFVTQYPGCTVLLLRVNNYGRVHLCNAPLPDVMYTSF